MTFQKSIVHIVLITVIITLFMTTCITSIYFQDVNAQQYNNNADDHNNVKLEQIRHMMGHGRHHMMKDRQQQQQESSMSNFSMTESNKTTTAAADGDNSIIHASIVIGAISRTTDAYQPNPIYLKEGQTVAWTNKDYNLHTVTQRPLSVGIADTALRFNSGLLSRGQSFSYIFDKEGT